MKKFIRKVLVFSLPIMLICIPCFAILFLAGELDGEKDYTKPLKGCQLIGLAYTDIGEAYKLKMTNDIYQPSIVALGSSRILKVKSSVISEGYSFYNAGGAINNIYQYQLFLNKLHYTPEFLIINIDQWFFNPNYQNQELSFDSHSYDFPAHNMGSLLNAFIEDCLEGKVSLSKLLSNDTGSIGLNAIINENGFASDGSHREGNLISCPQQAPDYNFKDTYQRIDDGDRRFEYGDTIDVGRVHAIDKFLDLCQQRSISVLAIIPPFAPAVYQRMADTGHYTYMAQIYERLRPVFDSHKKCFLYDYTDMCLFNVQNYDFVDGFHGSEIVYNIIIKDILQSNDELRKYFVNIMEIDRQIGRYNSQRIRYHNL